MAQQSLSMLRNRLRQRLGDTSGRGWPDVELNTYINEGARDVTRKAETNLTSDTVSVSSGVGLVTGLPEGILRIYRAEWQTADGRRVPLEYRDINNMDAIWWDSQNRTQSQPAFFCTQGYPPVLKVQLYPVPSEAGTLRVFFYALATEATTDADVIEVPDGWDDCILDYAEYRAYRRDGDQRWTSSLAQYEANLASMVERTRRYVEATGMIQQDNPSVPAWLYGGW